MSRAPRRAPRRAPKVMKAKRTTSKKAMRAMRAKKNTKTPPKYEMMENNWPTVGYNGWFLNSLENKHGFVKEQWLRKC